MGVTRLGRRRASWGGGGSWAHVGRGGPGLRVADEGGRGAGARGCDVRYAFGISSLDSLPK